MGYSTNGSFKRLFKPFWPSLFEDMLKRTTASDKGGDMDEQSRAENGIELLVDKCRTEFRRPENTDFYTEIDYKEAERKYVKFCLNGRP
jgi:hypothetical protein